MSTRYRATASAANLAGLTTALAFITQESEAAVELFTPDPSPFPFTFFVTFDPNSSAICTSTGDAISIITCTNTGGSFFSCISSGYNVLFQSSCSVFTGGELFTSADLGSDSASFTFPTSPTGDFYVGFGFQAFGVASPYNLGWVQLNNSGSNNVVVNWAYETVPGDSIEIGAIPEPSTTVLALAGAALAGVFTYKRFKSK